jgi:hypothetical protein
VFDQEPKVQQDGGVDFVGNEISFSVAPTITTGTSFAAPTFATPGANNISGTLQAFIQRDFKSDNNGLAGLIQKSGTFEFFDLRSEGATTANVASTIAGAAPREEQSGKVEQGIGISKSKLREISDIGIHPRKVGQEQLKDFLNGRALYNDVPTDTTGFGENYEVTLYRLPPDTIDRVLDDYKAAYTRQIADPSTGHAISSMEPEYVNGLVGAELEAYLAGGKPPEGFRAALQADPSKAEALKYLDGLKTLLSDLRLLGLNSEELESVRDIIASRINAGADLAANKKAIMGPD